MKLTAYVIDGHDVNIRPAPVEREWMEATNERFAYRCLPLNIANAFGWEILCPSAFIAIWSGGAGLDAVRIQASGPARAPVSSHFGHGTLTFHIPCLFRTEPGQARHCSTRRRHRNRLDAVHLHHELGVHAAGRHQLR